MIESEELEDIVLAVHSYAGMIGTAVADRMANRLLHLIYIDAVLLESGECWGSTHAIETRSARQAAIDADPLRRLPTPDAQIFGLQGPDRVWVNRRQTPHPGGPYSNRLVFDPARVALVPRTFISCDLPPLATIDVSRERARSALTWGGQWLAGSRYVSMETGHDPMVSAPGELVEYLLDTIEATSANRKPS